MRDYLLKNQRLNISTVTNKGNKNAKEAILEYTLVKKIENKEFGQLALLDIKLYTGRHHQIRVQMANAGLPLWGDIKYNEDFKRGHYNVSPALYSHSIELINPDTKKVEIFEKIPRFEPFNLFI